MFLKRIPRTPLPTGSAHLPCPITAVEASASRVVGSLPLLDEFAAPVHQEQHTAEQVTRVPTPQIQEQCVEGVTVIPQEGFPEQSTSRFLRLWMIQSR